VWAASSSGCSARTSSTWPSAYVSPLPVSILLSVCVGTCSSCMTMCMGKDHAGQDHMVHDFTPWSLIKLAVAMWAMPKWVMILWAKLRPSVLPTQQFVSTVGASSRPHCFSRVSPCSSARQGFAGDPESPSGSSPTLLFWRLPADSGASGPPPLATGVPGDGVVGVGDGAGHLRHLGLPPPRTSLRQARTCHLSARFYARGTHGFPADSNIA